MDDRGLRSAMVETGVSASRPHRPFALRAVIYTIAFLLFILGVVPFVFHVGAEAVLGRAAVSEEARFISAEMRQLIGITIFVLGFASYLFCSAWLIVLGRGPHVEFDPPQVFVASGPYRWVRNPVVITLMLVIVGEAVYFASPGIALLVLIGMPLAHYQVTRIEEPRLKGRFGQSYEDYLRRVPRWLPRPPID
jgi:protein-S-isoprenylcysteine O-methyltransferase Ste14